MDFKKYGGLGDGASGQPFGIPINSYQAMADHSRASCDAASDHLHKWLNPIPWQTKSEQNSLNID